MRAGRFTRVSASSIRPVSEHLQFVEQGGKVPLVLRRVAHGQVQAACQCGRLAAVGKHAQLPHLLGRIAAAVVDVAQAAQQFGEGGSVHGPAPGPAPGP